MRFFNLFYRGICRTVVYIMSTNREKIFYAVGIGHKVGVYETWSECKKQVTGVANSKFRKFTTLQEAEQFVAMWRNKSKFVSVQANSSNPSSKAFNFRNNDRNQLEYRRQQTKGDKKLKKKGFEQEIKKSDNRFTENVDTKLTQKFVSHNLVDTNKLMWKNPQSHNNIREKFNQLVFHPSEKKKYKSEVSQKVFPRSIVFHFARQQKINGSSKIVNQVYDTNFTVNQSQNNASKTNMYFNWNTTAVSRSQVSLLRKETEQVNVPILTNSSSYTTMDQTNSIAGFLEKPYVSPLNRYTKFIPGKVRSIASQQLPNEMRWPVMSIDSSDSQAFQRKCSDHKLISKNPLTIMDPFSVYEYNKNSESPDIASAPRISGSSTANKKVQSMNETNNTNERSQLSDCVDTIERKDTGQTYVDGTINDSNVVQQNMREIVKKKLTSLIVNHDENSVIVDTVGKVPNVIRVALTVGELEEIITNDIPTCSTMKDTVESGGTTGMSLFLDKLANCERKIDMGIGKIGEFLSCLTELKNELVQLKGLIPQNCVGPSKEIGDINSLWKTSASGFCKNCACNCDTGGDGGFNSQRNSQQSDRPRESKNSDCDLDDDVDQVTPVKRKRTWEDHSGISQGKDLDKEIKQECGDYVSFTTDENNYVIVYTDGSCMDNGTKNAKAGIGIWFDDGHPLNVSRPLQGVEPTNNNAEIQAARIACELAVNAGITKLKICTDSEFLINCITKWVHKWKTNGWLTEANKPVRNRLELEKLLEVISRLSVRWEKVAGHSAIKGNEMADRLANDGAAYYVKQRRSVIS